MVGAAETIGAGTVTTDGVTEADKVACGEAGATAEISGTATLAAGIGSDIWPGTAAVGVGASKGAGAEATTG